LSSEESYGIISILDVLGTKNESIEEAKEFRKNFKHMLNEIFPEIKEELIEFYDEGVYGDNIRGVSSPSMIAFGDTLTLVWEFEDVPPSVEKRLSAPSKEVPSEHRHSFPLELSLMRVGKLLGELLGWGISNRLLYRGAISVGKYIRDENKDLILGPAVNDAASWYEKANWSGLVATPKFGFLIEDVKMSYKLRCGSDFSINKEIPDFRSYSVPLKNGNKSELYSLGWPAYYFSKAKENNEDIEKALEEAEWRIRNKLCSYKIPKDTEDKYYNTLEFFDWYVQERYMGS